MTVRHFLVPVNPRPWTTPPYSISRANGKFRVFAGRDEAGHNFKEAVREELLNQYAEMLDPPYRLEFWFWRCLDPKSKEADATNMQKLCEDALQDIVITNDRFVRSVKSNIMEQSETTPGMILIEVEGNFDKPTPIPDRMIESVDRMHNSLKHKIHDATFDEFKLNNTWP